MNESKICMTDSTGVVVGTKKNIYNESKRQIEHNRSSECSVEDRRERNRFTPQFTLRCSCLRKVQVTDPCD